MGSDSDCSDLRIFYISGLFFSGMDNGGIGGWAGGVEGVVIKAGDTERGLVGDQEDDERRLDVTEGMGLF